MYNLSGAGTPIHVGVMYHLKSGDAPKRYIYYIIIVDIYFIFINKYFDTITNKNSRHKDYYALIFIVNIMLVTLSRSKQ